MRTTLPNHHAEHHDHLKMPHGRSHLVLPARRAYHLSWLERVAADMTHPSCDAAGREDISDSLTLQLGPTLGS